MRCCGDGEAGEGAESLLLGESPLVRCDPKFLLKGIPLPKHPSHLGRYLTTETGGQRAANEEETERECRKGRERKRGASKKAGRGQREVSGGEGVPLLLLRGILTPAVPTGATAPPQGSVTIPFFTVESARDNSGYVSGKGRTLREKGRNGGTQTEPADPPSLISLSPVYGRGWGPIPGSWLGCWGTGTEP